MQKEKDISVVSYYGNVYITVNLCIQSLTKKRATIAVIEDKLLGLNKLIVSIFNNILKEYKIEKIIDIFNNVTIEELKKIQNDVQFIVCVGNSNTYYKYLKKGVKNLSYIPFKNIALFCDDSYFKELKYELYKFSLNSFIEIEIYDDIDEYIECVNADKMLENVVVFTKSKEEIKKCEEKIKNYKLYINKNPFKEDRYKFSY